METEHEEECGCVNPECGAVQCMCGSADIQLVGVALLTDKGQIKATIKDGIIEDKAKTDIDELIKNKVFEEGGVFFAECKSCSGMLFFGLEQEGGRVYVIEGFIGKDEVEEMAEDQAH